MFGLSNVQVLLQLLNVVSPNNIVEICTNMLSRFKYSIIGIVSSEVKYILLFKNLLPCGLHIFRNNQSAMVFIFIITCLWLTDYSNLPFLLAASSVQSQSYRKAKKL